MSSSSSMANGLFYIWAIVSKMVSSILKVFSTWIVESNEDCVKLKRWQSESYKVLIPVAGKLVVGWPYEIKPGSGQ